MNVRRVLHPTDFSPSADVALGVAVWIALRLDAELSVGHVVYGGRAYWDAEGEPTPDARDIETRLHEYVDGRRAALTPDQFDRLHVEYHLIEHETPAAGILRLAEQRDADLIVMGTHGRRGIRRFLLGSVAFEVLHSAQTDILMVPSDTVVEAGGRILVPVDLRERSADVVEAAGDLARAFATPIDLVHVLDLPERFQFRPDSSLTVDLGSLHQVVEERLKLLAEGLDPEVAVTPYVQSGSPASTIVYYIEEHAVRFVMMASAGMSPRERALLHPEEGVALEEIGWAVGRVTERVVTHSRVPVWVMKRFAERTPQPPAPHYYAESEIGD